MCLCALFACAFLTKAQGLGDYMEIDGVPGFVFYVDETGEHGLVMSFPGISKKTQEKVQKKMLKSKEKLSKSKKSQSKALEYMKEMGLSDEVQEAAKKQLEEGTPQEAQDAVLAISAASKLNMPVPTKEISSEEKKKVYEALISSLSADGEQNAMVISDYCNEKGISMLDYFPSQYWASQLGEGWFIPGENELIRFAEFYTGGIGKDYKMSGIGAFKKQSKVVSNDAMVQNNLFLMSFVGIISSTMKDTKQGFCGLIRYNQTGLKTAEWFEFDDKATIAKVAMGVAKIKKSAESLNLKVVAVHKF